MGQKCIYPFPEYEPLSKELGIEQRQFHVERFPNGEMQIHLDKPAESCVLLGTIAPPDSNLLAFLALANAVKKEGAVECIACLPYLAYSRHEHDEPGKSQLTPLVGSLLQAAGIDRVVTIDLHSNLAKEQFPIPITSISSVPLFAEELKRMGFVPDTVVSPDEGGIERARDLANLLGCPTAHIIKKRGGESILQGEVGRRGVIVDDILDTGETLLNCVDLLKSAAVEEIVIMVTHGLFTGDAWKSLEVSKLCCTQSIPSREGIPVASLLKS